MGARRNSVVSKNWLNERREILRKIKDQVRLYLGDEPPDLHLYANAYKDDINRLWKPAKVEDVYTCLHQVDVAFGGDFHPFSQAQRAHLRLLRNVANDRPVVIGLEAVFAEDQQLVDEFLGGKIDEASFLESCHWEMKWGFPWVHYRPLFEFARKNNIPILALNTSAHESQVLGLHERDKYAAGLIFQSLQNSPDSLHYVIYGDLHIAQKHLPNALQKASKSGGAPIDIASIYLNSEQIYFSLAEENKEAEVDVVCFNDRQFCLLSSPPWVKWQSYLMYLEENFDVDLEAEIDDEVWDFKIDHTDHVSNLVKMVGAAFNLDLKTDAIEVYSLDDPQVLRLARKVMSDEEYKLAHSLVQNDQSFYAPQEGFFYLSKSTVNHAATLAGQFIHAQMSGRQTLMWNFPKDFLVGIWIEAMSFMLSKFVNPKRKAQKMEDLKKQLQAFDREDRGREPLLLALDQKMSELLHLYTDRSKAKLFQPVEKSSYVHAARFIGEMLGDRYFMLYQHRKVDIDKLLALLKQDLNDKYFAAFYYKQLKFLDKLEAEEI